MSYEIFENNFCLIVILWFIAYSNKIIIIFLFTFSCLFERCSVKPQNLRNTILINFKILIINKNFIAKTISLYVITSFIECIQIFKNYDKWNCFKYGIFCFYSCIFQLFHLNIYLNYVCFSVGLTFPWFWIITFNLTICNWIKKKFMNEF